MINYSKIERLAYTAVQHSARHCIGPHCDEGFYCTRHRRTPDVAYRLERWRQRAALAAQHTHRAAL